MCSHGPTLVRDDGQAPVEGPALHAAAMAQALAQQAEPLRRYALSAAAARPATKRAREPSEGSSTRSETKIKVNEAGKVVVTVPSERGWSSAEYMAVREAKLAAEAAVAKSHLFAGVVAWLDGRVDNSKKLTATQLVRVLQRHGGVASVLPGPGVTHIIACSLPDSKHAKFGGRTRGHGPAVVHPEWLLASVAAGRRLPEAGYSVLERKAGPGVGERRQSSGGSSGNSKGVSTSSSATAVPALTAPSLDRLWGGQSSSSGSSSSGGVAAVPPSAAPSASAEAGGWLNDTTIALDSGGEGGSGAEEGGREEGGAAPAAKRPRLSSGRAALPALATAGGEASLPPSSRTALAALLDAAGAVLAELHDSAPWRLALYELVRAQIGLSYSPAAPSPPRQQQPQATRRPPAGEPAVPLVSQSYNQFLTADADAAPPACSPAAFAALVGPPLWRRQGYAARPPRAIVYPSDSDDDGSTSSSSSSSSSCNCASRASPPGSSSSSSRRRQRHALEGKPAAAPGEESSQEVSDGASSASEDDDASDVDEAGLSLTTRRRPAWWWPPHSASPTNELWRACAAGNVTAVARLLADPCYTTDAVINAAGPDAWTPLAVACLRAQDAALVAALLHAGADASRTPSLLFAVLRACDLRLLRLFCDMQPAAVVSVRDRFGASLLHAALAEDCVPAVQLLARAAGGALVNAPIVDLEELDEPRAKIRPAGAASIPALAYLDRSAFTSPRLPSAAALASCAAPPTAAAPPLAWSPRMRAFPVSAAAEAMYYDDGFLGCHRIRAAETPGMTPLGLALAMGNLDAVAAVLEAGGDPNAPASRSRGSAPSVFESLSKLRPQGGGRQGQGARDAVALLVEAGADLNVAVGGGAGSGAGGQSAPTDTAVLHCPALHAACAAADYRSVVLLLRAGACSAAVVPPGSPRGGGLVPGNSPLHTAAAAATVGNCRSIKLQRLAKCATTLLAAGAPAAAPNGAGKAAWEVVAGVKAADLAAAFGGPAAPLSSAAEVKK